MSISQKDLINEGFLDIVRGVGAAAKKVAQTVAPITTGTILDIVSAPKALYSAFASKNPTSFLKEVLKTEYRNTFDPKSIKNVKEVKLKDEPSGTLGGGAARRTVTFNARRFNAISTRTAPGTGGVGSEETFTAIMSADKSGNISLKEIRDSSNRVIRGEKESAKKAKPRWDDEYAAAEFTENPTVSELGEWVNSEIKTFRASDVQRLSGDKANDLYKLIAYIAAGDANLDTNTQLTPDQIKKVKDFFIQKRIVECSQINTLQQLNFLYESLPYKNGISINESH